MNWKDVLHFGSAAGVALIGLMGAMGAHIPGVTIDPMSCFLFAGGIFGAGLKGGWSSK